MDTHLIELKNKVNHDKSLRIFQDVLHKVLPRPQAFSKNNLYIIVPKGLQQHILSRYHSSSFGGHGGSRKTKSFILKNGLWWSTLSKDVLQFTRACQECQKIKGDKSNKYDLQPTNANFPFNKVCMDFFGPLPATEDGNRYILV